MYGSYARGDFDADSYIDIAAIIKGYRQTLQIDLKKEWYISSDLELEYETIVSPMRSRECSRSAHRGRCGCV